MDDASAGTPEPVADLSADIGAQESGRAARGPAARDVDGHATTPGVAALIVAHDQARRIAATVRAARSIPGIDLVLVVDDASSDNTQELARKAGAVVVRHSHQRGRAASVETGASVIAMRDVPGRPDRAILLLPASLGRHAVGAAPLVTTVAENVADLAVGLVMGVGRAGSMSSNAARRAVEDACRWKPLQPLSPIRCLTREALEEAMPLVRGGGLEVGMTLDVIHAGLWVTEVQCDIHHRADGSDVLTTAGRASQYRDVMMAIGARRMRASVVAAGSRLRQVRLRPGARSEQEEQ